MMKMKKTIIYQMMLGMVLLLGMVLTLGLTGCSESGDDDGSSGKGSVAIRLRTQYVHATRATGDWADPTNTIEKIHDYKVVFVDGAGKVAAIATGNANGAEEHTFRYLLAPGTYTVYGFANFDGHTTLATDGNRAVSYDRLGITLGSSMPNVSTMKLATTNGWAENIPMTSRSGGQTVTVRESENQSFEVELIRSMAKLELDFENEGGQQIDVLGYEVFPLTTTDVSLLEPANEQNITTSDSTTLKVDLSSAPLVLMPAGSTTGSTSASVYTYVNETNATATSTHNEYSIRLRTRRHFDVGSTTEEYRYGFTVSRSTTVTEAGKSGLDYIHRNDWIKLPLHFTDWMFQVEALPFPPIAGFQARMVTADAMTITFNTGGYVVLHPQFRKGTDPVGVWRTFSDSDVTITLPAEESDYTVSGNTATAMDANDTGIMLRGDLNILEQMFVQLPSGDIVGKLTNNDVEGQVTVTLRIKLEGFYYQFHYTVIRV